LLNLLNSDVDAPIQRLDQCLIDWVNSIKVVTQDFARSEQDGKTLKSNTYTKTLTWILIDNWWPKLELTNHLSIHENWSN
jgi:hypothetical protein